MTANFLISLTLLESEEPPYRTQNFDELEHGKPVIIHAFHGTTPFNADEIARHGFKFGTEVERHSFTDKAAEKLGRKHLLGDGVYFADRPRESQKYGGSLLKVEVHLRNPYVVSKGYWADLQKMDPEELQRQGHDGIVVKDGKYGLYGGENYRQGVAFDPASVRVVKKHAPLGRLAAGAKIRHKETGESGTVRGYRPHGEQHMAWRRENNQDDGSTGYAHVAWNGSKKLGTKRRTDYNVGDHEVELK